MCISVCMFVVACLCLGVFMQPIMMNICNKGQRKNLAHVDFSKLLWTFQYATLTQISISTVYLYFIFFSFSFLLFHLIVFLHSQNIFLLQIKRLIISIMEGLQFPWAVSFCLEIIVGIIKCKWFMTNTAVCWSISIKTEKKYWKMVKFFFLFLFLLLFCAIIGY